MAEAKRQKILIAGWDSCDLGAIRTGLLADGFQVRSSETAEAAVAEAKEWQPEIVIADEAFADPLVTLRRSGVSGSVLVRSRSRASFVELLDDGADDCVENTCSVAELRARIRSKLKYSRRFTEFG